MGQVIVLNTSFTNPNLPALIDRDVTALEAEILKHPNLMGFWDFSDVTKITKNSDGVITKVADKSAKNRALTASAENGPTYDALTVGNMPTAYFNGSKFLTSETTIFKSDWNNMSIVVFALKPEATNPANTMLTSYKGSTSYSLYTANNAISLNAGRARLVKEPIVGMPLNIIASTDFNTDTSWLRTPYMTNSATKADLKATEDYLYVGRWSDGGDETSAGRWNGYIGHVMVFNQNLEMDPIFMDLLLEYGRRKYGTPLWE